MKESLALATSHGLVIAGWDGAGWCVQSRHMGDQHMTSIIALGDVLLAGTQQGVVRSRDGGQSWQAVNDGLTIGHIRWLATQTGMVFAGTEPAALFVSQDDGTTWSERKEVAGLAARHRWFLPYSPAQGCIRGFALLDGHAYAAAEVGGVLRSDDGGATWQLATGSDGEPRFGRPPASLVHPDVHSLLVHPSSPDLVLAATGGGLYRSADGGATWQCLYECYCRAVWADPGDANHVIFGPAQSVERNGRIEESRDGGRTWRPASSGLTVPWSQHMVERLIQNGEQILAVLSNGELIAADVASLTWRSVPEVSGVTAVAPF
jgi:photosystem II stability/assembly factor-like uncharacterized protein